MFSLCNQFSPCICLSLSFSVPFNSLLSLALLFFFFRSCSAAIDRSSWLEVNPRRTPDSFVRGGYRGDPPWPWTHRGLVRGQAETISPLQSDGVKGRRRTAQSTRMRRLLGTTRRLIWDPKRVCDGLALCVVIRRGGWTGIRPVSMTFIFNGTFSNGISYKVTTEWKEDQTASPDLHMYSGIWEHSA